MSSLRRFRSLCTKQYNINIRFLSTCYTGHRRWLSTPASTTVNHDELLQLLKASNNDRKQKKTHSPPNEKHQTHVMDLIRTLHAYADADRISTELALNACFFITHYHTDKAMKLSSNDVDAFVKFQEIHHQDITIGWDLLNRRQKREHDAANNLSNLCVWKIEMATRLEDTRKIYEAFLELLDANKRDFNAFSHDQLMIAFSTIPYIGQWRMMLEVAQIFNSKIPDAFVSLYNMAQSLPIPDFSMVYEALKENESKYLENEISLDDEDKICDAYQWNMYEFANVRVRFQRINCYQSMQDMSVDTKKENEISSQISEEQKQWTVISCDDDGEEETDEQRCVRKMGAICQTKSFYEYGGMNAIQMYGPWLDDEVHVKGRVDIPIYAPPGDDDGKDNESKHEQAKAEEAQQPSIVVIHEEQWDLVRDEQNRKMFRGEYSVRQRNEILDTESTDANSEEIKKFAPMDWIYELEITMK